MTYTQPTLHKNNPTWYIEYYEINQTGKKLRRIRETGNINRIKDLQQREYEAAKLLNRINAKCGFSISSLPQIQSKKILLIIALDDIFKIIESIYDKARSIATLRDMAISFKKYLCDKDLDKLKCDELSLLHVQGYFDYLRIERKTRKGEPLRNNTINNHQNNLRWLFNHLKKRGYIAVNHFESIKKIKESEPINRHFEEDEKEIVLKEIFATDTILTYAVLLVYRCGVRSFGELSQLKPIHFDFNRNLIKIPGVVSKSNKDAQFITIPSEIKPFLIDFLKNIPKTWYIIGFGKGLVPHPDKHFAKNALYERHKKILQKLHDRGELLDIRGLTIYQWKHTGAYELIDRNIVDIETLRVHLRHEDINTTQRYFAKRNKVQAKILDYQTGLVPLKSELSN